MVWAQNPVVKGYWVILNIKLYIKGTVSRDFRPIFSDRFDLGPI